MKQGLRILAILAVIAGLGLLTPGVYANCFNDPGLYELIQCGNRTWFAPPPAGAGALTVRWWQLGFGNATVAHLTTDADPASNGTGIIGTTRFIGNDSGFEVPDILMDPPGSAPGSFCFSSAANWGAPGIDGCADNRRVGGVTDTNYPAMYGNPDDQRLNPYFGAYTFPAEDPNTCVLVDPYDPNPCTCGSNGTCSPHPLAGETPVTRDYLLDAPIAVLATEASGTKFALAFLASTPRAQSVADNGTGDFQFKFINNGDPDPNISGLSSKIPWQSVPDPNISAGFVDPNQKCTTSRVLTGTFTPIRLVHDGSSRPSPATTLGTLRTGVGVLDQGALARYQFQRSALDPNTGLCTGAFAAIGTPVLHNPTGAPPSSIGPVNVAPNSCVRLATSFGRNPVTTLVGLDAASRGNLGDLGYTVFGKVVRVGSCASPLVSEEAYLTVLARNKNMIQVDWNTNSELSVTGFDIVGIDGRGAQKVIGSASCKQCTTGLGATYSELIPSSRLGSARQVQIVTQPSGARSNILDLKENK
ncbi:MAG TPA: hypothetical protein VGK94_10280 [Candidatus Polarisedimenticolia bacterium]